MYYLGQTGMTPEEQERVYHQEAAVAAQQHQMAMAAATAAGMMKTEDGESGDESSRLRLGSRKKQLGCCC